MQPGSHVSSHGAGSVPVAASQRDVTSFKTEARHETFHVLALDLRVPLWGGEGRTDKARVHRTRVRARDRAHSAAAQGCAVSGTPAARSEPFAQRRARHRGRVLFGDFLLHEQEKVTRRPGWPVRPTGM